MCYISISLPSVQQHKHDVRRSLSRVVVNALTQLPLLLPFVIKLIRRVRCQGKGLVNWGPVWWVGGEGDVRVESRGNVLTHRCVAHWARCETEPLVNSACRGDPRKGDRWRRMKRKQSISDITDGDLGSCKSRTPSWNGGVHQIHPDSAQRTNTALKGYGWTPALGSERVRTDTMLRVQEIERWEVQQEWSSERLPKESKARHQLFLTSIPTVGFRCLRV